MKKIIFALIIASSITSFAKQDVEECLNNASSNTAMKVCVYAEYDEQDKILNHEYKKLMSELKKDETEQGKEIIDRVINNQRAWIAMRDTTCAVEGIDMLGGTGEGLIVGSCLGKETETRVEKIKELQRNLAPLAAQNDKLQQCIDKELKRMVGELKAVGAVIRADHEAEAEAECKKQIAK